MGYSLWSCKELDMTEHVCNARIKTVGIHGIQSKWLRWSSLPAMQETQFRSLGWEDPLEKATYFTTMSNGYPLQYYCLENSMVRGAW